MRIAMIFHRWCVSMNCLFTKNAHMETHRAGLTQNPPLKSPIREMKVFE